MKLIVFFFFFSSRRRHTRLVSDWSSDVCSSDLNLLDARSDADVIVEIEFLAVEEARNRMRTRRIPIGVPLRKRRSRKNSWEKQKDRRSQDCPHRLASWNFARLIVTRQQPFGKLSMSRDDFYKKDVMAGLVPATHEHPNINGPACRAA